jgi:hypothetical protein
MLANACPYVSWQWAAKFSTGTARLTSSSRIFIFPGVPIPMVSPKLTSWQPISISLLEREATT